MGGGKALVWRGKLGDLLPPDSGVRLPLGYGLADGGPLFAMTLAHQAAARWVCQSGCDVRSTSALPPGYAVAPVEYSACHRACGSRA